MRREGEERPNKKQEEIQNKLTEDKKKKRNQQ